MHLQDSHKFVNQAIETIVAKGGQKLYESYIKTKIPNHATGQITEVIIRSFNTPYSNTTSAEAINKQVAPQGLLKQSLIPYKINKSHAEDMPNMISSLRFQKQLFNSPNTPNKNRRKLINGSITERPFANQSSVYQSLLNAEEIGEAISTQVRKQKQKSIAKLQKLKKHQQQQEKQRSFRRRSLQRKVEQFQVNGIPYAYDQQGNIIAPTIKEHKNNLLLNSICEKRENRMVNIKFQTLDLTSSQRYSIEDAKHIVGRRRGFTSSKFYKKLKMTNQEFNNQNNRQNSNIPYLNLNDGIKIIQREKNIIAEKRRKNDLSKDKFKQKTQQNFFKSFMPDFDLTSMQTMSVDRPYTTAQMNRTKRTSQTINTQKLQSSILWRPKTTSKNCRVNINDQQLAKKVIQID